HAPHPPLHSFPTRRSSDLVAAILAALQIFSREPMTVRFTRFERQVAASWRKLILVIGVTGALLAIVVAAIWASYAFRFSPFAQKDRKSTRLNSSHQIISYA